MSFLEFPSSTVWNISKKRINFQTILFSTGFVHHHHSFSACRCVKFPISSPLKLLSILINQLNSLNQGKASKTETKIKKKFVKRVAIRHKEKADDMAAQLALQRNFVTITPSNQITSTTAQTSQSTTTMATSATNGEIVTITDTNQISTSETNTAPIHIMQTHTQVMASMNIYFFLKFALHTNNFHKL